MRSMTWGAVVLLLWATAAAGEAGRGKQIYETRCAFCHGADGRGDGPAGAALQPPPTNFTDPAYWKGRSDDAVRLMVVAGKPGTAMLPFGQTLKADEIDAVVDYLGTFR